jgi:FkbM family methyltransferase
MVHKNRKTLIICALNKSLNKNMLQMQKQQSQIKSNRIPPRGYLTYGAHLFKAIFNRYHQDLKPIFAPYIPAQANIIDVGAHAGQFSKLFSDMVPNGHIYAFEPARYTRSILSCVKTLHRLNNVTIVPLGLGDNTDELTLNIPIKTSGSLGYGLSHIGETKDDNNRPTYQETISLITLDNYIADQNISHVDFIKADIEGWELRMLTGAKNTLIQHKPTLFLEINDLFLSRAGDSAQDMLAFLKKHNYNIFILDGDDKGKSNGHSLKPLGDTADGADLRGDILCVHTDKMS